jgi:hypothetical protein
VKDLFLCPEDNGRIFHRNVGNDIREYMTYLRGQKILYGRRGIFSVILNTFGSTY